MTSLSVIIPTFRRAGSLRRAIDSALVDAIDDIEVLVIDDDGEQSARAIVEAHPDRRVRYLTMATPTGGVPALVRNYGIEEASGEVLYFLDDDDVVAPGALTAILAAFARRPGVGVGVVFGTVQCEGPDADEVDRYQYWYDWAARTARRVSRSSRLTAASIMFKGTLLINSCCAVRRSVALEQGGYDPELAVYEDVDFYLRCIRAHGHVFIDDTVLLYTTGEPSIIHDLDGDTTPIEDAYTAIGAKYRATHGSIEYQALRAVCKLLPLGTPYLPPA